MKTFQFQNQKDLFSAEIQNTSLSAPIYKEKKGKRSNFTFKSSTSRRRPFYFSPGPSDVEALPSHYNYIIKAGRCKANIDESRGGIKKNITNDIFHSISNVIVYLYIEVIEVQSVLYIKVKLQSSLYIEKEFSRPKAFRLLEDDLVRPSPIYKAEVQSTKK